MLSTNHTQYHAQYDPCCFYSTRDANTTPFQVGGVNGMETPLNSVEALDLSQAPEVTERSFLCRTNNPHLLTMCSVTR